MNADTDKAMGIDTDKAVFLASYLGKKGFTPDIEDDELIAKRGSLIFRFKCNSIQIITSIGTVLEGTLDDVEIKNEYLIFKDKKLVF